MRDRAARRHQSAGVRFRGRGFPLRKPKAFMAMHRSLLLIIGALALNAAWAAPFRLVQDVYPGSSSGTSGLVASGDHLFFWGVDGVDGTAGQPWRSDGTTSGTAQVGVFLGG